MSRMTLSFILVLLMSSSAYAHKYYYRVQTTTAPAVRQTTISPATIKIAPPQQRVSPAVVRPTFSVPSVPSLSPIQQRH